MQILRTLYLFKAVKLGQHIEQDSRGILITTIFKFQDVDIEQDNAKGLNDRSNIIVLVDEAHRTQEGSLGEKMRWALPNAFFFGLTGTPISTLEKIRSNFLVLRKTKDAI